MDCIEEALRLVEHQEGGVDDFEELFVAPDARGRVDPVDVDAAAMPFALRGRERADIGEQRHCAAGSRLRFGMSSPHNRRACHGHGGRSLKHDTPIDAPVCDGCFGHFPLLVASKRRLLVKRKIADFYRRRKREPVVALASNFQAEMTAETSTFRPPSADSGLCHNDRHRRPCSGHDGTVLVLGGISYPANGRFRALADLLPMGPNGS
jgi:hypothetical protein